VSGCSPNGSFRAVPRVYALILLGVGARPPPKLRLIHVEPAYGPIADI
jgi:hypothetical protein